MIPIESQKKQLEFELPPHMEGALCIRHCRKVFFMMQSYMLHNVLCIGRIGVESSLSCK